MKLRKTLLIAIFLLFLFSLPTCAHSGRTDGSGGHHDSFTGEYHYHHGQPAHQHPNGICPYANKQQSNDKNATTSPLKKVVEIVIFGFLFGGVFGSIIMVFAIFYDGIKHNKITSNSVSEKIFPYVFKICIPLFLVIGILLLSN